MSISRRARVLGLSSAVLCLLGACPMDPPSYVTEHQIRGILQNIDRAVAMRDVAGIVAPLASDAVITVMIKTPEGSQTETMSARQYRKFLERGFEASSDIDYERTDTRIEIAPDRTSAKVRSTVTEKLVLMGRKQVARTAEAAKFEARGDRVVISSLIAIIQFQPGERVARRGRRSR